MTTATLAPAHEAALAAREGRELYRVSIDLPSPERGKYRVNGRMVGLAKARAALAKGDPVVIPAVKVLKPGIFYGMNGVVEVFPEDFPAMVARYEALRETGTFDPPWHADHSWSVYDVIGWSEGLSIVEAVDPTDDVSKPFLCDDLRITQPWALDMIDNGTFVKRSSELGAYSTNAGVLYERIYYGCAFVDIPAVEGLGPVTAGLSKFGKPRNVIDLTSEGKPPMPTPPKKLTKSPVTPDPADVDPDAPVTDPADVDPEADPDAPADEPDPDAPVADPAKARKGNEPDADLRAQLAAVQAELDEQRAERVETALRGYQERGVVNKANLTHVRALLSHEDKAVRDAAKAMLDAASAPVKLGRRRATLRSVGKPDELFPLGMDRGEAGRLWASLTREQRKDPRVLAAYDAWRRDSYGAGDDDAPDLDLAVGDE